MNSPVIETISRSVPWALRQLRQYLPLLALPPLLCAALAIIWILVTPPSWKAHQSLLVRDDMLGDSFKPGRFTSLENQKNAQETLLHIARKPEVIRTALTVLGPEKAVHPGVAWPSEELLYEVANSISIFAPNGAEFGKTDVVVLSVKSSSRERAKKFADLLAAQIELNLRNVRQDQLRSMQTELELAASQLQREYDLLSQKVKQVELAVGPDLPVLRSLLDRSSSASDVQRAVEQIRQERRLAENELEVARKQLELLQAIESDPDQFSVSSSELLTMQPIFKKLREGLTDAELRLLTESGRYEPGHPAILHAREVIAQTKDQIRREARAVIQGLQLQTATAQDKLDRLRASEQQYDQRVARVAEQRVEYEVLARELEKGGETLGKAKTELAQVQSLAESADKISLITRVGEPQADLRPEGLSKKSMVLLAILGGLLLGGGLVGLCYRPDPQAPWLPLATNRAKNAADANSHSGSRMATPTEPAAVATHAGETDHGAALTDREPAVASSLFAGVNPAKASPHPRQEFSSGMATRPTVPSAEPASSQPIQHLPGLPTTQGPAVEEPLPIAVPQVEPAGEASGHTAATLPPRDVRSENTDKRLDAVRELDRPTSSEMPEPAGSPGAELGKLAKMERESVESASPSNQQPAPLALPGKIDLAALKQQLAEAAKLTASETQTGKPDERHASLVDEHGPSGPAFSVREPAGPDPATERSAATPAANSDARSSRSPVLNERIEFLSQSIATFCDAIRIEPPSEGAV